MSEFKTKREAEERIARLREWIAIWDVASDDPFIAKSYRRVADEIMDIHQAEVERIRALLPTLPEGK